MLKATFSRYLFNKEKQRGRGQKDCTITKKIGMGEGEEERVPFIRHEELAAEDSVSRRREERKKKTMIRVYMLEWLPRNESYRLLCRDSEEKFFSVL